MRWPVALARRHFSSKPFYITTPIFYVNAKPHIGHLYSLVLTDVLRRFQAIQAEARPTFMLTGVDEHGMKIQRAAEAAGRSPLEFCDAAADVFQELPGLADVSPNIFMRTTSNMHKRSVSHLWRILHEKGMLYTAKHRGWYSVSDETFFPEAQISDGHSIETGNAVEWTEEENWHFRLSEMREPLLRFYQRNPSFIIPNSRFLEVRAAVEAGLEDLSVSRPSTRLPWGIPVPGDPTQTIYVWLDALTNYLSACGYPELNSHWPADVHVIGKDILRFHCIYWPAFLLAAGIEPPKKVLSHSHWTLGNLKMSKSRGNVVDPWVALDMFGRDSIRYYLMREGRIEDDANYDTRSVLARHNNELVGGVGNLLARLSAPRLDVAGAIQRRRQQAIGEPGPLAATMNSCAEQYTKHMTEMQPHRALGVIVSLINACQIALQRHTPWSMPPSDDRDAVMAAAAEGARIAFILLQPIIPTKAAELLERFGVEDRRRSLNYARYGADDNYRPMMPARGELAHVFTRIEDSGSR
ncbi:methionyl-tRNA synthetase [Savitreella phatthalungensis]